MHLVHVEVSKETLGCVEPIMQALRDGHATGVVMAVIYRRRRYGVTICGEAIYDASLAHTATCVASAELMDLIRERGERATTL